MFLRLCEVDNIKIESDTLREYLGFKSENLDYILLFQIGSFYETLFEDAKIFSQITGCTMQSRTFKSAIEVAQSGVNKDYVNVYIKKLLNNNHKVCVCSEFKDENNKSYREITRKYTQGTISEYELLDAGENNFLSAINYSNNCYNIAYADVSTGQFFKTTAGSKEFQTELDKISPKELLIASGEQKNFKDIIAKYNVTLLDDDYFKGAVEDAIIKYCKNTQKKFATKLEKIKEYKCSSYLAMDDITRRNLELTRTKHSLKKKGSILWFLNYTKTPMGARLLKKFLNEPLMSKEMIIKRQDAIEELIINQNLLDEMQDTLEHFADLSRICAHLSNATISPKDLLSLAENSYYLNDLKQIILNLKSDLFKINSKKLDKTLKLAHAINSAIKKNCPCEIKSGGIIKEGYSAELDFYKNELSCVQEKIEKYKKYVKSKLNIEKLDILYSPAIGYYIEVLKSFENKLPNEFYKKHSTQKLSRFSSKELQEFEEEINNLKFKTRELEYELYRKLRIAASEFVETIRALAYEIGVIDVITSFAKCALLNNLSRPKFVGDEIIIKEGYHPSLLKLNNEIVKNDTRLNQGSIIILTGANMSGKSTYLKYNAIICVLAQIGSFVPAKSAVLPIIDKIFFRQSASDDIINNNSSFMVEMNDLKYILENTTNSSYTLLDEPAKSTNAKEGGAIARAFCEYILKYYKNRIIVATHNEELTKLEKLYPDRAINYVIGTLEDDFEIANRKVKRGVISKSYAINTAILAQLPQELIARAKAIALK
ncbi:DNA mismatch repair protein MutS [bacterium]|nr:DNA mismatch repair protein MutS [bacterium]